jgi:hypothetical protein
MMSSSPVEDPLASDIDDLATFIFAVLYATKSLLRQDNLIRFPSLQLPRSLRLRTKLLSLLSSASGMSLKFCTCWYLLCKLVPLVAPTAMSVPLTLPVILHLFVILFLLGFCWQLGAEMLQIFSTEILRFDQHLLEGLRDSDRHARFLAFACLADLAEFSPRDREYLFDQHKLTTTQKVNDSTWQVVCDCLVNNLNSLSEALYEETLAKPLSGRGWLRSSPSQRCVVLFRDLPLHVWSAQTLSMLAAASAEEDELGVVQRSLTAVLSALLTCSLAIQRYASSPSVLRSGDIVSLRGAQLARPVPIMLSHVLDNAIYRITERFFNDLGNIALPPSLASHLQSYVHFRK